MERKDDNKKRKREAIRFVLVSQNFKTSLASHDPMDKIHKKNNIGFNLKEK